MSSMATLSVSLYRHPIWSRISERSSFRTLAIHSVRVCVCVCVCVGVCVSVGVGVQFTGSIIIGG